MSAATARARAASAAAGGTGSPPAQSTGGVAAAGRAVTGDEFDAVMARITTASAAFRAALETAEAAAT